MESSSLMNFGLDGDYTESWEDRELREEDMIQKNLETIDVKEGKGREK